MVPTSDSTSSRAAWIADLRRRLEHGDLDDLGPIDLGYGTALPARLVARILLADLDDDLEDPAGLSRELDMLRALIG